MIPGLRPFGNRVLASLEQMDVDSMEFDVQLAAFEQAVSRHAETEENQEFAVVQAAPIRPKTSRT